MGKYFNFITAALLFIVLIGIGGLLSCNHEEIDDLPTPEIGANVGYIRIHLNVPDLRNTNQSKNGLRAMDDRAESAIRDDLFNVLVFKNDGAASEIFCYKAPVSGSIVYNDQDLTKAVVTVKLVKSENNEKYRIVVIANYDLSGVMMTENVTTKNQILEQLTYSLSDKWNANSSDYTPFPMWGEIDNPVVITNDMILDNIDLYRALARVDIGLNFTASAQGILSENAVGLDYFRVRDVAVYRTYNKGYVAPLNSAASPQPSIPLSAVRKGDQAPLNYSIPVEGNSLVREIYLPEADLPSAPNNGNIHCIVIGGYYKGSSDISYYRLDFATEDVKGTRTYRPILRNHRYIFNITQVRGPGFPTVQDALQSNSTIENLGYDMVEWNENIHNMEIQGKYYFGLDDRHILFTPVINEERSIIYQTNLPTTEPFTFIWKKGTESPFKIVSHNSTTRQIKIATNQENITNKILTDTLLVQTGPFSFPIVVDQQYVNFDYSIDCESVVLSGIYIQGTSLVSSTHYITLTLVAKDRTIQGRNFIVETVEMDGNHGISFRGEGTFDFTKIPQGDPLKQTVVLKGSGTLKFTDDFDNFTLRVLSNSSSDAYCEVTIHPVLQDMNIVVMALNNVYGYPISRLNGGAAKLFNSTNNFGPYDHSIIKTSGNYNYIYSGSYSFYNKPSNEIYKWVTGIGNNGKIADMVYVAYDGRFATNEIGLLVDYLDRGGVIVIFSEDASTTKEFARILFNNSNIEVHGDGGVGGYVYPLAGNQALFTNENERAVKLRQLEGDPILNGPFGDIRDKQIGDDAGYADPLKNFPVNDPNVTIYSYNINLSTSSPNISLDEVMGYKYESESRNLFYWCDGGLMSSADGLPNVSSTTITPLNWSIPDAFPIPMPSYGTSSASYRKPVYNSTMFCNVLAWAVRRSQQLKAKREGVNVQ